MWCESLLRKHVIDAPSHVPSPTPLPLQMSLQGLISGSECAVPSNPLAQVLKHTEGDRSLQQVCTPRRRLESSLYRSARIGSRDLHHIGYDTLFHFCYPHQTFIQLQHLPGSAPVSAAEQDVEMARQFFGGPTSAPSLALTPPGPHAGLSRLPGVNGRFDLNQAWARGIPQQQQPAFHDNMARAPWASDFSGVLNQAVPGSSAQAQQLGQQGSDGMY